MEDNRKPGVELRNVPRPRRISRRKTRTTTFSRRFNVGLAPPVKGPTCADRVKVRGVTSRSATFRILGRRGVKTSVPELPVADWAGAAAPVVVQEAVEETPTRQAEPEAARCGACRAVLPLHNLGCVRVPRSPPAIRVPLPPPPPKASVKPAGPAPGPSVSVPPAGYNPPPETPTPYGVTPIGREVLSPFAAARLRKKEEQRAAYAIWAREQEEKYGSADGSTPGRR